ncbi:lysis protein [Erwinia rhapontici]|uniref:lysis protein n=1 Tax=Erwinia rhapontici TaxID=55212 RepID=UPI003D36E831
MTWLVSNWRFVLVAGLILLCIGMAKLASGYHERAITAEGKAKEQQQTIADMQLRQRDVAALDAKYTGELADAKAKLDDLQQCVRSGKCGLRVNASCSKSGATTSGVGDDATPRLTDSAERDYFTLRGRISTITGQVNYLQQYIREQCSK